MKIQTITILLFATLLWTGCSSPEERINNQSVTSVADYQGYLDLAANESFEKARAEAAFWQKRLDQRRSAVNLSSVANAEMMLFDACGKIEHLKNAETLLTEANQVSQHNNAGLLRALGRNYITQHRFREALPLALKADSIGEKKRNSQALLFDIYLELGDYTNAEKQLNLIHNKRDFDYLIRLSKWMDHKGDLDKAIEYMEGAKSIAESRNSKSLKLWSYSNLADYYGHAGRIEDSYQHYLKTLDLDPNYTYALRGIAWITFSKERDCQATKNILNAISEKHHSPDLHLLRAEIADYEKDEQEKQKQLDAYFAMTNQKSYGQMYNKYHSLLFAEDMNNPQRAIEIALQEVANRPCPQSYDLLAWARFNAGQQKEALRICQSQIEGKTFEPEAQYHSAVIYRANGLNEASDALKEELRGAVYELGPTMEDKIENI